MKNPRKIKAGFNGDKKKLVKFLHCPVDRPDMMDLKK